MCEHDEIISMSDLSKHQMFVSSLMSRRRRLFTNKHDKSGDYYDTIMRFTAFMCIVLDTIYFLDGFSSILENICAISIIVLSIMLCIKVRENNLLIAISMFITWANYSAMVACYSKEYARYSSYDTMYQGTAIAAEGTFVLLLFMSFLLLFLPKIINKASAGGYFKRYRSNESTMLVLITCIILMVIWVICSSGFSGSEERGSSNQLFEYSYILFLLGFFYAGENRLLCHAMCIVAGLYIAQNILSGNRAGIIAIVLLIFALFYAERIAIRHLIPIAIASFLLFMILGSLRQDIVNSWNTIPQRLKDIADRWFVWDTASYAYVQSLAFVRLLQHTNPGEWMHLFTSWIEGIVLGGSLVKDSSLSLYAQKFYPGMGGGFFAFYFYYYFGGVIGVPISGIIVAKVFKMISMISDEVNDIYLIVSLGLFVTVHRWYIYSTSPLNRGILLTFLMCKIGLYVTKKKEKGSSKKNN